MPEEKRKISISGTEVDATVMPFQAGAENWNEYLLNDGTVLRVKLVATEVLRLDGVYSDDGEPVYLVKSQNVTATSVPNSLRKKRGRK